MKALCHILFLLLVASLATAQEIRSDTAMNVRIGIYDYQPMAFLDAQGGVKGVFPDIINDIAAKEKWHVEYIYGSWEECLERLDNGRIDLLVAIAFSQERAERFRFNKETVLTNWGLLYVRPGLKIMSFADLDGRKIAVYRKGIFSEGLIKLLRDIGLTCEFIDVADYRAVFRLIEEGRVDAGVSSHLFGVLHAQDYAIEKSGIIFNPTESRFAAPKDSPASLLDTIDAHLIRYKADKSSVYYQSINRWAIDRWVLAAQQKRISDWIVSALVATVCIAALLFVASVFMRRQIREKALALIQSDARLGLEIEAKEIAGRALEEKERMLSTLMGNLPGMVYRSRADADRTVVFVSDGSRELLGYGPNAITALGQIIHAEDRPAVVDGIKAAIAKGAPYRLVYRVKTDTGAYKWVGDQGVGVYDATGAATFFEGFITDITQQQETELALRLENERLRADMNARARLGDIVGKGSRMQAVFDLIEKAAASEDPVIITGESGTGKELTARAIHDLSRRSGGPFIPVNCSAIPENLMESEFFGHVKGAFTGADTSTAGLLDAADGGTLFLDEIGDIAMAMQVKLLRAIEGGGYMPVGDTRLKTADIRIVAATNKNLESLVEKGRLREDFYYRLSVIPIRLPALRHRREDIPLLVDHFLAKFEDDALPPITPNVMEALVGHPWPGNVRELQNTLHRYVALGALDLAGKKVLPVRGPGHAADPFCGDMAVSDLRAAIEDFEKRYITWLLNKNNWHRGKVADILKINRKTLFSKIKAYRIKQP